MISIHAPTRGATGFIFIFPFDNFISIHAPTRGATIIMQNSFMKRFISIHAPTRGATIFRVFFVLKLAFQSTLLQEERQVFNAIRKIYGNFNPRSYKRSDLIHLDFTIFHIISIHAPTRGATITLVYTDSFHLNFNPRSYKRSDNTPKTSSDVLDISIHAPTRGATISSL